MGLWPRAGQSVTPVPARAEPDFHRRHLGRWDVEQLGRDQDAPGVPLRQLLVPALVLPVELAPGGGPGHAYVGGVPGLR